MCECEGVSVSVAVPAVCAENHVRSWTVTRFRGRISTQPDSAPIASFKVLSLEGPHSLFYPINSIGACVCVCVVMGHQLLWKQWDV